MNRYLKYILVLVGLVLFGCSGTDAPTTTTVLPLADDRPTFLWFYTDN